MKINQLYKSSYNFNGKYKTADILRLTTSYPYKSTQDESETVKSLTGIDMESDTFTRLLPQDAEKHIGQMALIFLCGDKIRAQSKKISDYDDTFVARVRCKENDAISNEWFKKGIKEIGSSVELEPFEVTSEELEKSYDSFMDIVNQLCYNSIWQ